MRTTTIELPNGLIWDSLVQKNADTDQLYLDYGLSYEVWHYIGDYNGMTESYVDPEYTWGSGKVRPLLGSIYYLLILLTVHKY